MGWNRRWNGWGKDHLGNRGGSEKGCRIGCQRAVQGVGDQPVPLRVGVVVPLGEAERRLVLPLVHVGEIDHRKACFSDDVGFELTARSYSVA